MKFIAILLLIVALYVESIFTTLPVVLMALVLITIFSKDHFVFSLAFFFGVLLDSLLVRHVGQTSVLFLFSVLLIFLYERKFETRSLPFVIGSSFVLSFFYLLFYQSPYILLQVVTSCIVTSFFFILLSAIAPVRTVKHII